jgi:hypothetical protein
VNLHDVSAYAEPPDNDRVPRSVSVHQVVVTAGATLVSVCVWHRTHGDYLLTVTALPLAYCAFRQWIRR